MTSDPVIQQTLYILIGLVLVLVVMLLVAWRVVHVRHLRKMASLSAKEHQMVAASHGSSVRHDFDLQLAPMGDSTLKVNKRCVLENSNTSMCNCMQAKNGIYSISSFG